MKKIAFVMIFTSTLLFTLTTALAYPFCGPYEAPHQDGSICRNDLVGNDTYRVQQGIPFVWLRSAPSSDAAIVGTVYPSASASLVTAGSAAQWDGYQWWWEMSTYPNPSLRGYVERASLSQVVLPVATPTTEGVSDPSIQIRAQWQAPFQAVLDTSESVSFAWVRDQPQGTSILYTLRPKQTIQITGAGEYDNYQWWWPVEISSANVTISGWVEQGSISPLN